MFWRLGTFSGRVEADETYIGAKARYMHKDKRTGVGRAGLSENKRTANAIAMAAGI
jgi:hypothetical protein